MPAHKILPNLKGQTFGRLKVVSPTGERGLQNRVLWLCRCACGVQTKVSTSRLISGNTQSCGCLRRERMLDAVRKPPFMSAFLHLGRKRRNQIPNFVQLTYEEFLDFTKISACHYCAAPVHWAPYGKVNSNLDRKNSREGYVKENCVVCCYPCNRMKGDVSYNDFILRCRIIASKHPGAS
jgi:hypothetical protein